jgi:CRISPR-associated endonuclease/helicase Cas3
MGAANLGDFAELVRRATGHEPYAYQRRLATDGFPEVLAVPTGSGKTLAAALSWLYRRRFHPDSAVRAATPRRLVYVLPMRVLVEQTRDVIDGCLRGLAPEADDVVVELLLGGEPRTAAWRTAPERDMVIVGTLDMILSRAINRGYGESRFMWPVDFGLLNADCLYVYDEVQLMGPALATSRQLEGLRQTLGTAAACQSMWMSATVATRDLLTADAPVVRSRLELGDTDIEGELGRRVRAAKRIERVPASGDGRRHAADLASYAAERHRAGTLTLVVVNTVARAHQVHRALAKGSPPAELVVLHSQFRPQDRRERVRAMLAPIAGSGPGRIVISTQVVEAGVDLSATLLVIEAAPWSSVVQRAGRCNRDGLARDAVLAWLPPPRPEPYPQADVDGAAAILAEREGMSCTPSSLGDMSVDETEQIRPILRRKDLLELFDTLPDISGNDLDVSRFIRDTEDLDVSVAWRSFPKEGPDPSDPLPARDERCPVPVRAFRDFVKRRDLRPWTFDALDARWRPCRAGELRPGMVVVLPGSAGGYQGLVGWDDDSTADVPPVVADATMDDRAVDDDPASFRAGHWVPLRTHLSDVEREVTTLLDAMAPPGVAASVVAAAVAAGRLHDIGKGHPVFQNMLRASATTDDARASLPGDDVVLAKSATGRGPRPSRLYFRHELASALALLDAGDVALEGVDESALAVYLVAAHHGRVRMGFRPLPGEVTAGDKLVALGIEDGELLPAVAIPGGVVPESILRLKPMGLGSHDGRPSWASMALRLRDRSDIGPFRLAWLEAVVRIADWRASANPTIDAETTS